MEEGRWKMAEIINDNVNQTSYDNVNVNDNRSIN